MRRPGTRRSTAPPRPAKIRDRDGPRALAGFGSAKGSNEEAYLFQKLVRTGFGTNNVDHCTRLCHASSVAALLEGVGSAAVTATFNECKNSDVIIVIGANPTENHPVAATFFKQAAKRGAKLVVMDPRGQALKRHAWQMMQFKNGTDVAMLNAHAQRHRRARSSTTSNTSRPTSRASSSSTENVKHVHARGDGADLRHRGRHAAQGRAHLRPRRKRDHLLGHGRVAAHPRHRQRALPDRAVADLPARSAGPARACIRCAARTMCRAPPTPASSRCSSPTTSRSRTRRSARKYEEAWGVKLDPKRGKTVVEIMDAVHADEIKGMYIMGENPAMSDPDLNHARERAGASRASRGAGHLPHRDRVLCRRHPAGLGLAGEGRHRHQHQPPGADGPRRRCRCRARRGRTSGSSRISRSASAATGTTSTSARCSPRWRR